MQHLKLYAFLVAISTAVLFHSRAASISLPRVSNGQEASRTFDFSYSDNHYEIPFTYLARPFGVPPDLVVTYPDLRAVADAGACPNWFAPSQSNGCRSFDFFILGPGGPIADDIVRRNLPLSDRSSVDQYGYIVSWNSKNPALLRFTRKVAGRTIYFFCGMRETSRDVDVCTDHFLLSDGDHAGFHFPYRLRGEIPQIELVIANLVTSFRVPRR